MIAYLGLAACICLVGVVLPVGGQAPAGKGSTAIQGIPGYLDPRTGTFKPLIKPPLNENLEAGKLVATGGEFVVTFDITVKSAIPSGDTIACELDATAINESTAATAEDTMGVAASRSTGMATCTVSMYYSWPMASGLPSVYSLSYIITAPALTTSAATALPNRISLQPIAGYTEKPVPADGIKTTVTVDATI